MSKLAFWIDQYGLPKGGVIHVGAHEAQEAESYSDSELEPVLWFEAIPELVSRAVQHLSNFPRQQVFEALLWSQSDQVKVINLSSNDLGSSSVFDFHLHSASYPEVKMFETRALKTSTLDLATSKLSSLIRDISYLVLDVQGAELEVLKGSMEIMANLDAIMVEVSTRELYKGAPVYPEVIDWLEEQGFTLIADDINHQVGWGDAFFIKSTVLKSRFPQIEPLKSNTYSKHQSWTIFLRGILVKIGIKPEFLTKSFLKGVFRGRN